jgi:hypothetical protein
MVLEDSFHVEERRPAERHSWTPVGYSKRSATDVELAEMVATVNRWRLSAGPKGWEFRVVRTTKTVTEI